MMLAYEFVIYGLYYVELCSLYAQFLEVLFFFHHKWMFLFFYIRKNILVFIQSQKNLEENVKLSVLRSLKGKHIDIHIYFLMKMYAHLLISYFPHALTQ